LPQKEKSIATQMEQSNILSKDHFAAYRQVVSDYTLLLALEDQLKIYKSSEKNRTVVRVKKEIILILTRIIENKIFLAENAEADTEYLERLQ
jgi:hypothetical protein